MKIYRQEEQAEQAGKADDRAKKIIRMSVVPGNPAHDYDQLSISVFLNLFYSLGQRIAGSLIEFGAGHLSGKPEATRRA